MIGCREPGIVVRSVGENPAGPKLYEMVKVYVGTASSISDRDFQEDANANREEEIRAAFEKDGDGHSSAPELTPVITIPSENSLWTPCGSPIKESTHMHNR